MLSAASLSYRVLAKIIHLLPNSGLDCQQHDENLTIAAVINLFLISVC